MSDYQICTRCIMDTSDPEIVFNSEGVCNHCLEYDKKVALGGYKKEYSEKKLDELIKQIKFQEKDKEYDCIIGISGGVDSAYMAHLSKELGLRVLAVHVDAGWNSEVAVKNIQNICQKLSIDLHTIVIDWPTMKELQRAYMFSGLPNLDVPQDHVFIAAIYQYAKKYNIKYMLNGSNIATEGILPGAWGQSAIDFRNIKGVYKKCGRGKSLKKYPHVNILQYFLYQKRVKRILLLNYVPYTKKSAIELLSNKYEWKYYGGKHFESRFTKFFQSYYLPQKFGYDKKRAHLSSLVVSGELSRDEALKEMNDDTFYKPQEMLEDRDYILKKLDISLDEWNQIMLDKPKIESDYPSNQLFIKILVNINRKLKSLR